MVKLAVAECYLVHISPAAWLPNERDELLNLTGRIRTQFRLAGPSPLHLPLGEIEEESVRYRAETLDLIRRDLVGLDISRFELMPLNCNWASFLEALLNAMHNETCGYQSFIKKVKNQSIKKLTSDLALQKSRPVVNSTTVDRLELWIITL